MNSDLRSFMTEYLGVVISTLVPVVLTAFMSIPVTLGGHPGQAQQAAVQLSQHMT